MVDKSKIKVIVQKFQGPACEEVYDWLRENNLSWRHGASGQPIAVGRNQNVLTFLKQDVPLGFEHLLMLDDDMIPLEESLSILSTDGDLLYCAYPNKFGGVDHYGDGMLCAGCLRMSAKLLLSLKAPYFRTGHSGDITQYTNCDCNYLRDRAREQEVDAKMVGIIGHLQKVVLMVDAQSAGKKFIMKFRGAKNAKMEEKK